MLEECFAKVVNENKEENCSRDNFCLERTRSNTPRHKGAQELRRFTHASGNQEDIARRGTLTQFHQRVAIGRTRIDKDKKYLQRTEEPRKQKHHFTAEEFMRKINKKNYIRRFLTASKIIISAIPITLRGPLFT